MGSLSVAPSKGAIKYQVTLFKDREAVPGWPLGTYIGAYNVSDHVLRSVHTTAYLINHEWTGESSLG